MNIILEGPDATGKTTLSEKLQKKYGMGYLHSTSTTPNDLKYHMDLLDKENMVFDRFMCGEFVYPEIYGREPKMSFDDILKVMQKIVDNNDILIIMYASDLETLKERLVERGELNYLKEIEQQNILFQKLIYILDVYEYKHFLAVDVSDPENYKKLDDYIDRVFNQKTVNIQYRQACRDLLEKGHEVESPNASRGNSLELNNYMFTVDDIEDNVVTLKTRDTSLTYLAAELLWYWQSRNDVDFIGKFAKLWKRISDDGKTSNSAYGYLLQEKHGFNQIETIIDLLKKDPSSRRAVLNLNVPNPDVATTKDEICTICLNYFIRDGKLHCTGMMRSNDIIFGLTYDITYFTQLQKYIARRLEIPTGSYTHFATSIHGYDKDFDKIRSIAEGDLTTIEERLDIDWLLVEKNMKQLTDYVDNNFVSKEDFTEQCKSLGVIRKR